MDENKRESDNLEQPEHPADEPSPPEDEVLPSPADETSPDEADDAPVPTASAADADTEEAADESPDADEESAPEIAAEDVASPDEPAAELEDSEEDAESAEPVEDTEDSDAASDESATQPEEDTEAEATEADDAGFDDFDIESALAAVATLEHHDDDTDEYAADDEVDSPSDDIEDYRVVHEPAAPFTQPPFVTLSRGRGTSVVPALLLIVIGVWLTVTLTTTPDTLNPLLVIGILPGVIGITLIVRWLSTSRWERGSLLLGTICLFGGIVGVFIAVQDQFTLAADYPLFGAALGTAFIVTAALPRKKSGALFAVGAGLIAGSIAALFILRGTIAVDLTAILPTLAPILAVVVVVVLLLPLLIRQRG